MASSNVSLQIVMKAGSTLNVFQSPNMPMDAPPVLRPHGDTTTVYVGTGPVLAPGKTVGGGGKGGGGGGESGGDGVGGSPKKVAKGIGEPSGNGDSYSMSGSEVSFDNPPPIVLRELLQMQNPGRPGGALHWDENCKKLKCVKNKTYLENVEWLETWTHADTIKMTFCKSCCPAAWSV